MKSFKLSLVAISLLFATSYNAQFIDKLVKKAEKKIEREAENRTQKK
ncbi:hypothetical protein MASR1M29_20530 [Cloacibacterium normanense]